MNWEADRKMWLRIDVVLVLEMDWLVRSVTWPSEGKGVHTSSKDSVLVLMVTLVSILLNWRLTERKIYFRPEKFVCGCDTCRPVVLNDKKSNTWLIICGFRTMLWSMQWGLMGTLWGNVHIFSHLCTTGQLPHEGSFLVDLSSYRLLSVQWSNKCYERSIVMP